MQNKLFSFPILLLTLIGLAGCGQIIGKMISLPGVTSKYNPLLINESDVNSYYKMLAKVSGTTVSDELGSHYFSEKNDTFYRHFTYMHQDQVIKDLLSSSYGLLEPVYTVQPNTLLKLDWNRTQQRHAFLTQEMGLKLLPLSATKKYHQILKAYRGKHPQRVTGVVDSFAAIVNTNQGEQGLYNSNYYSAMKLGKIASKADYLVLSSSTEAYHLQVKMHLQPTTDYFAAFMKTIPFNQTIGFVPFDYLKNISKGGAFRAYTSCTVHSKPSDLYMVNYQNERTNVPYLSALAGMAKDQQVDARTAQRNIFLKAQRNISMIQHQTELACQEGFQKLGLSGTIESSTLD